jgi:hypothetical protein
VVIGGAVVVPMGLLEKMTGGRKPALATTADTLASAARARATVMEVERRLGFEPVDREAEKLGYDNDRELARKVVHAFVDLYAHERSWQVLHAFKAESEKLLGEIWDRTFEVVDSEQVHEVVKARRLVISSGATRHGQDSLGRADPARLLRRKGNYRPVPSRSDLRGFRGETVARRPDGKPPVRRSALAGSSRRRGWQRRGVPSSSSTRSIAPTWQKVLGEAVLFFEPGESPRGEQARTVRLAHGGPAPERRLAALKESHLPDRCSRAKPALRERHRTQCSSPERLAERTRPLASHRGSGLRRPSSPILMCPMGPSHESASGCIISESGRIA